MEKNGFIGLFIAVLTLFLCNVGYAQQEITVKEAYYQSRAYPETFTDFVRQNSNQFDKRFHECLNSLFTKHHPAAEAHARYCSQNTSEDYLRCIQRNEAASIVVWIICLREVTLNNKNWENTKLGDRYIIAKRLADMFAPGFWVLTAEANCRIIAPLLSCK